MKARNEVVSALKKAKCSLYKIHKELGVSYNTVVMWDKGVWQPKEENVVALKGLLGRITGVEEVLPDV